MCFKAPAQLRLKVHAQLDGHTAATQWPEFGIMVCRQSSTDPRNGFFIVGARTPPGGASTFPSHRLLWCRRQRSHQGTS